MSGHSSLAEHFYTQMALIRRTEETFFELFAQGLLAGTVHTSIGQEACAVGVVNALDRERDVIFSSHRAHGHFLVYCDDVLGLVAELLGRKTGVCGGVGGTQHLHKGNLYTNGVQGGILPNAVGAALAEQQKGSGAIVCVFLGDGTMGEGVVYESMNLASLWSLPVLFVLEDNQYAQSTHRRLEHAGDLATRPASFQIERLEIEADDVFAVFSAASAAVHTVRTTGRPFFLKLNTYRLVAHSKGDDTRAAEELAAYKARDPFLRLAQALPAETRAVIDAAVAIRVAAAVTEALTAEPQTLAEFQHNAHWPLRNTQWAVGSGQWAVGSGQRAVGSTPLAPRPSPLTPHPTYLDSLRQALHAILTADPTAVVLGEDILDPYGGAFKVTQGLSTRFPARVFTTPISEAAIVGASVGLALRGLHPIAEIMFGDFLALVADQIVNHAAKYPAMYNGQVQTSLIIRAPMGGGRGYGPTHSQSLERLFFGIPHLKLVAPSHAHDPGALLKLAVADPEPVIFVENKLLYPLQLIPSTPSTTDHAARNTVPLPRLTHHEQADAFGYPVVTLANYAAAAHPDVTVIAYGGMSRLVVPVLERLQDEEIRLLACLPSCISPLDMAPLVVAAAQSGRVLIVEESQAAFGWGAEVAACLYAELGVRLQAPIVRLGAAPTVIPAARALEDQVLVTETALEAAILHLIATP